MIEPLLKSQLEPVARRARQWRVARATALCFGAAALVGLVFYLLKEFAHWESAKTLPLLAGLRVNPAAPTKIAVTLAQGVTVTPGDTSVERGHGLVVLARFDGRLPAEATLVIGSTPETLRRVPLVKNLADPVFGGGVPEV